MRFAIDLLTEAAEHPECDELFRRIEWPTKAERLMMIERMRLERNSWGDATLIDEEPVESG